jgi:hypothetical protein
LQRQLAGDVDTGSDDGKIVACHWLVPGSPGKVLGEEFAIATLVILQASVWATSIFHPLAAVASTGSPGWDYGNRGRHYGECRCTCAQTGWAPEGWEMGGGKPSKDRWWH